MNKCIDICLVGGLFCTFFPSKHSKHYVSNKVQKYNNMIDELYSVQCSAVVKTKSSEYRYNGLIIVSLSSKTIYKLQYIIGDQYVNI